MIYIYISKSYKYLKVRNGNLQRLYILYNVYIEFQFFGKIIKIHRSDHTKVQCCSANLLQICNVPGARNSINSKV